MLDDMKKKYHEVRKQSQWFKNTFKTDIKQFYKDLIIGFDVIAFDDYLKTLDENYRKANDGELGEDVDCSMETHLKTKYGEEAMEKIKSFM